MRPGELRSLGALQLLLGGLIAGCSPAQREEGNAEPAPAQGLVVLSVGTGPRPTAGPIQGRVRCGDDGLLPTPPCLAEDLTLAEAVLACGPTEATIDRGASHSLIVRFPAGLSRRFPGMPADLEIVRCVQTRVGFPFSAGVAAGPDGALDPDPAPFTALHTKPAPESGATSGD